jgi:2-isopropylmalate synthase
MGQFGVHYAEIGFAGANQFVSDLTAALLDNGRYRRDEAGALRPIARARRAGCRIGPTSQFMVRHKQRVPVAVVVVKSRLLDVAQLAGDDAGGEPVMARETVACLQHNGLKSFVDFEHAMDAWGGRRENGEAAKIRHAAASICSSSSRSV